MKVKYRESGDYVMHEPEEWLAGKIIDIEENEGKFGPGLKFILNLDDDEPNEDTGEMPEVWAFTSQILSPKSKLYAYVVAVLGEEAIPEEGDTLDLDEMLGKKVDVFFERYQGIDKESGKPVEKEKVTKMRAQKKAGRAVTKKESSVKEQQAEAKEAATARRRRQTEADEAPF